jgi:hypothetical protein
VVARAGRERPVDFHRPRPRSCCDGGVELFLVHRDAPQPVVGASDGRGGDILWQDVGHANNVVAMAGLNGKLYCVTNDNLLWWREPVLTEVNWTRIGRADKLVALAAMGGKLFAVTPDGALLWLDALA